MKPGLGPALATSRATAALAAVLLTATGCASDPALGPGDAGGGLEIRTLAPALLVGAVGGAVPARLAVEVREGSGAPVSGVEVSFRVRHGNGRLLSEAAVTDSAGVASVGYAQAGGPDSTAVRVAVPGRPRATLDLTVLARPALTLSGDPGTVLGVPGASRGVLLRVPPGETYDIVPYVTAAAGRPLAYAFQTDSIVRAAGRADAPHVSVLAPAGAASGSPGHAVPAGVAGRLPGADALPLPAPLASRPAAATPPPPYMDVANCRIDLHRRAPLAFLGERLALYVDAGGSLDADRVGEIGRTFELAVAPREEALFGEPTDLDGNGRVLAVMTRSMPRSSGVYCESVHEAGREVIYAAWDADLPVWEPLGVLAHEYQHLLHASGRYRAGSASRADVAWVNEGLSFVAEWKTGFPAADLRRTLAFLGRLNGPLPLLGDRYGEAFVGGWFLFALYLGDRFGEGVYRGLAETALRGRTNVERVTGIPFRGLVRDWFVTLALSDAPPAGPPAWRYVSIGLAGEEARAAACGCLPGGRLPGVPFEVLPAGGDFVVSRGLDVQDADFFRFTAGAGGDAFYFQAGGEPDVELFAVRRR